MLFDSFRRLNPGLDHHVFSESSADRFIAAHFGARELAAFRACAVPAMQADYFRYCAVLAMGGIYSDADYRCVRPLQPLLDSCEGGILFLRPDMYEINGREAKRALNGFFAFRDPGHPLLELTLEIATANMEARISERVWTEGEHVRPSIWMTVGPGIFTVLRIIRNWGSFDAFLDGATGTVVEPFGELICEVVGDYSRVIQAFEGVRVASFESMFDWIAHPDAALAYKATDRHWHNVTTKIFRELPVRESEP